MSRKKTILAPEPGVEYNYAKEGRGRKPKDTRRTMKVTMTADYRGENDDELCFMFRGATMELLRRVFDFLIGGGNGIAKSYRADYYFEQSIRHRQHDHLLTPDSRIIVTPIEPNYGFASLEDMIILIEARLHYEWPVVFWYEKDVEKWLNMFEMPRKAYKT